MAYTHVEAEVLAFRSLNTGDLSRANPKGTLLPTPPYPQDATQNLESLDALFAAVQILNECKEPPRKRRKTDTGNNEDLQTVWNQADRSVILAKVSITLVRTSSYT